jgi:hypothetical protein
MTRAVVARRLGKSIGAVRFHEGKELHPRQDAEGVWRFDPAEVEALVAKVHASQRTKAPAAELTPGKLAARACELFRDGKTVVDVVIALEQPFEVVQSLYRAYLEDTAGMHVSTPLVERMAAMCEVDEVTPEIVVETLETNRRLLGKRTERLGGRFVRTDSDDPRK